MSAQCQTRRYGKWGEASLLFQRENDDLSSGPYIDVAQTYFPSLGHPGQFPGQPSWPVEMGAH